MAGIDPDTGELIYYPPRRHGGGLSTIIGPLFMIVGGALFLWSILEIEEDITIDPVKTEQTEQTER